MKEIYQDYLFQKRYLVAGDGEQENHAPELLFAMAALFFIRIREGRERIQSWMIPFAEKQLGREVPEPFYRGFPQSVRSLSADQLLFDQYLHYAVTYGLGHFEEAGHSLLEEHLERAAFAERPAWKDFSILTETEAEKLLKESVTSLLSSSRPLSDVQYALVKSYIADYHFEVTACGSKNTVVRLLADTRDLGYLRFLSLSDVIKLVDEINFRIYQNDNIKKLNLRNPDRKFLASVINGLLETDRCDVRTCFEKKAVWNGLLHHIHYKPANEKAAHFAAAMRGRENLSVYADFERAMAVQDIREAVRVLREGKSTAAVMRNLAYLISRCSSREDADFVLDQIGGSNVIVQLQLLMHFSDTQVLSRARNFRFTYHNAIKLHQETPEEVSRRRSALTPEEADLVCSRIRENLQQTLQNRLGRVYLDPEMKRIALPLQENTAQGGLGVLPKGSRLPIEAGRKLRAFTYWEKVNDIDLSVIGIDKEGRQTEFSWRTMAGSQSQAITYSGDETSGYHGGSEYFDVDLVQFKKKYPGIRHLVFCDNVFSGVPFAQCLCKAGYMIRDTEDSGQIFEPRTVQSSYLVNCDSTFAYLFGIDLVTDEFVWLNAAREGRVIIAGETSLAFLDRYFQAVSVINMYDFFAMMASELVTDPAEADVIVSDRVTAAPERAQVIRSCDTDKVLALMNGKEQV